MPNPITNSPLQDKLYFRKTKYSQPITYNSLEGKFQYVPPEDITYGQEYDWVDVIAFELSYNYKKPKEGILILETSLMFNVLETLETQSK